jgi:hypothetical protein
VTFVTAEVLANFVPIVDRLITLVKARDESHQHLVNDIIAPYFGELESAYAAYLATLRKAKTMLENNQPFPVVYSEIESLRATDLILRDKVREMAEAYESVLAYLDVADFFRKAGRLFGYWNGYHNSGTLRVMTALQDTSGAYSHKFVIKSIAMTTHSAEEQWRELSRQYALIRAKYLQPKKIVTGPNRHASTQTGLDRSKPGFSRRLLNSIRDRIFPVT